MGGGRSREMVGRWWGVWVPNFKCIINYCIVRIPGYCPFSLFNPIHQRLLANIAKLNQIDEICLEICRGALMGI